MSAPENTGTTPVEMSGAVLLHLVMVMFGGVALNITVGVIVVEKMMGGRVSGSVWMMGMMMGAVCVAGAVSMLLMYHRLTAARVRRSAATRCGRCATVLRGLERPECPVCGEGL